MAEAALKALQHGFSTPLALVLLALLPVLTVVGVLAQRRRRWALARLGRFSALAALTEGGRQWRGLRSFLWSTALTLLVLGIAGPRWGREPGLTTPGRELIVLLDLSRSMLADDVPPNRLGRAKEALAGLVDRVQRRGGHRLALVVFAARGKVVCPLTQDYDHFREKLLELDAAALPPDLRPGPGGPTSGTRFGAGLREAVAAYDPSFASFHDILMVSDGDDPALEDGEWLQGVAEAQAAGIPVHTVGIGDPIKGAPVPAPDGQPLRHGGQVVISRLQKKPLEEIARRTGGTFLAAQMDVPRLGDFFRDHLEPKPGRELNEDMVPQHQLRYAWFFGAALGLLALEMALGRSQKRLIREKATLRKNSNAAPLSPNGTTPRQLAPQKAGKS